jgi:hypothetical protein
MHIYFWFKQNPMFSNKKNKNEIKQLGDRGQLTRGSIVLGGGAIVLDQWIHLRFNWLHCSLVEQELLTLPEHLCSPLVFSGVLVSRSLVLYVCFVDRCLSFCTFSFGHCVVCSSSIYGFWLPLWYLQTLLIN